MIRGRPRLSGTNEEKAQARRLSVRMHVRAYRRRQKDKAFQQTTAAGDRSLLKVLSSLKCSKYISTVSTIHCTTSDYSSDGIADVDSIVDYMPVLPAPMNYGPACQGPFLDLLVDRYLPHSSVPAGSAEGMFGMVHFSGREMPISCTTWLVEMCGFATSPGTNVLSESMLSLALSIVGAAHLDRDMQRGARIAYQKALARIQKEIATILYEDVRAKRLPGPLGMACIACAMTELIANRSVENFYQHLEGIALLIQKSGPASLNSPLMRALFYEHRGIYVVYMFLARRSCFYSTDEWREVTLKDAKKGPPRLFHTLLDIAYLIPELMESCDSSKSTTPNLGATLLQMLKCVARFQSLLDKWRMDMKTPFMVSSGCDNGFDHDINFASLGVANSLLYYYAFKIHLNQMTVDIATDLALHNVSAKCIAVEAMKDSLDYARTICRSMKYCLHKSTGILGNLIGLFPFDAAWQTFNTANDVLVVKVDLNRDLDFCQKTAKRYRDLGVALCRDRPSRPKRSTVDT